jgi:hypothetical protein
MPNHRILSAGARLAAVLLFSSVARAAPAAPDTSLQQLEAQIAELRQSYEARLQSLESRLAELQQTQQARQADAPAPAQPPAQKTALPATPSNAPSSGAGLAGAAPAATNTAFNPAISLILNGRYAHLSRDPADYRLQGFLPSGDEVGPGERGLRLGESELGFAASIDPTFSGRLTLAFGGDEVEVEEALFERQGPFDGASLAAGRFLSSVGYLNNQHSHAWDFVDAPLAYQAFFGGQLRTDGLRLRWLAPTQRYLELGAEVGAGSGFPGNERHSNAPGMYALYAHLGDDIGVSSSWRAGVSLLSHRASQRQWDDTDAAGNEVVNAFSGRSRTLVLDGVYKWAPGGNPTQRNLKIQGEYFQRRDHGTIAFDTESAASLLGDYRARQSGWYLQAVYQFMPMWRVGARYDRLSSGTPGIGLVDSGALTRADFPRLASAHPARTTLMVDYSLSEFSRFRLQLANDRSRLGDADHQIFLQYIMSLGAHGAHTF